MLHQWKIIPELEVSVLHDKFKRGTHQDHYFVPDLEGSLSFGTFLDF